MDVLPTTSYSKTDRKSRSSSKSSLNSSSKPSLFLAFFSCFAWIYIAGRLWQDAENRKLLANLLEKNSNQRPKYLTVEDKLTVFGCRDLQRRIVEAEMELTLVKSQGYLQLQQSESTSGKRLLAVIGVYTGFGSRLRRNVFRGSWMPRGDALKKLEERGVVIRFVIGRSANRGDSLDRNIDEENRTTKDFLIIDGHEEAEEELPKKAKFFFSTAVQKWDADFYVKVDDNIDIDLDALVELLESRRSQDNAYIGCMKSGEVVAEEGRPWYEPDWWKFGDEKSYFRHASGSLFILSKKFAQYININSASLKTYAYDDTSVGSWMMGLQATYIDDSRLCCSNARQEDEFAHCSDNQAYYISNKAETKADGGGGGSKTSTIIKTTSGYWREKKKDIAIYNTDGQIIGYKTRYVFCCGNNDETSWRMDEFTVNPETIPADARDQIKETIACRIRVKRPKEPEGPYCEDEELEEEEEYEADENEE